MPQEQRHINREFCHVNRTFSAQRKAGKDPVFVADSIPGMPKTDCWHLEEVRDFGEPPVKEYLDEAIETDYVGLK